MNDAQWMDLFRQVNQHRDDAVARQWENVLAILAGEYITIFGRKVEFAMSWPDGLPMGFTDESQLREWAAGQLAKSRERVKSGAAS